MAYGFNGASQYLSVLSAPVTDAPITMSIIGRSSNNASQQFIFALGNSTVSSGQFIATVYAGDVSGDPVSVFLSEATLNARANSTTSYTLNTFENVVALFTSTTSRTVYLNGGNNPTANTDSRQPTGIDRLSIGALLRSTVAAYLSGQGAEAAIWSVALSDAEIASLAKGFKPYRIRPQSLVFYAPLIRELIDVKGALAITNNNTATVERHPRVY
jgi:hypothetical protein